MRFAYRGYEFERDDGGVDLIRRPALKVLVSGRDGAAIPLWGVVDTGAMLCDLPYEVADVVRPKWEGGLQELEGSGGEKRITRLGRVALRITLGKRIVRWSAVVPFDKNRDEALWGMEGFLNYFRVTFDGPGQHLTIKPGVPTPDVLWTEPIPPRDRRHDDIIGPDDQDP